MFGAARILSRRTTWLPDTAECRSGAESASGRGAETMPRGHRILPRRPFRRDKRLAYNG